MLSFAETTERLGHQLYIRTETDLHMTRSKLQTRYRRDVDCVSLAGSECLLGCSSIKYLSEGSISAVLLIPLNTKTNEKGSNFVSTTALEMIIVTSSSAYVFCSLFGSSYCFYGIILLYGLTISVYARGPYRVFDVQLCRENTVIF